jgi:hypothetical protein
MNLRLCMMAPRPAIARLRDEILDGEIFYTLREAQSLNKLTFHLDHTAGADHPALLGSVSRRCV